MGADQHGCGGDLLGEGVGLVHLRAHGVDEPAGEVIHCGLDGLVAATECVVDGTAGHACGFGHRSQAELAWPEPAQRLGGGGQQGG